MTFDLHGIAISTSEDRRGDRSDGNIVAYVGSAVKRRERHAE